MKELVYGNDEVVLCWLSSKADKVSVLTLQRSHMIRLSPLPFVVVFLNITSELSFCAFNFVFCPRFNLSLLFQYQADVMKAVFGNQSESSLLGITAQDSLLALIALPGYFVAVAFVGELGPRAVQVIFTFIFRLLCFLLTYTSNITTATPRVTVVQDAELFVGKPYPARPHHFVVGPVRWLSSADACLLGNSFSIMYESDF